MVDARVCNAEQKLNCLSAQQIIELFQVNELIQKARKIFENAVEIDQTDDRNQFVSDQCEGDPKLKEQVESLFEALAAAPKSMDRPLLQANIISDTTAIPKGNPNGPSRTIGPYKLLQMIGEGGMGEVWMAEQTEPIRRRVALKLIKSGTDSKTIIARFEAERQALAMMNHNNIARVFDVGETDGSPYFVMELVHGTPINEFCDANSLTPSERLDIFSDVCQAVQHAHHKGIIHRDLKPSNVLVEMVDGKPVAKVIDFGLAKALQTQTLLTDKTYFTEFGKVIGTLQYMSPEQASMDIRNVDSRSDVYSLGVMLYELLTGSTPIEKETLKKNALLQVLELVREKEPPLPSVRVSSSVENLASVSGLRNIQPYRLKQILKGDLDWIALKALNKEPNRRYETASSLSDDIGRYLSGEPIEARPPSVTYKVRKTLAKHRLMAAASFLVLSALIAALVGTTYGMYKASEAEKTTKDQLKRERAARFLTDFFKDAFRSPDPQMNGRDVKVVDILSRATIDVRSRFEDQPSIQSSLLKTFGETYEGLGVYEEALSLFKKAYELSLQACGQEHRDTIAALNALGLAEVFYGSTKQGLKNLEVSTKMMVELFGLEDIETLDAQHNLCSGIIRATEQDNSPEADKKRTTVLDLLNENLDARISLKREKSEIIRSRILLGRVHTRLGNFAQANEVMRNAIDDSQAYNGSEHPDTLLLTNNLATAYYFQHKYDLAVDLLRPVCEIASRTIGPDHPNTMQWTANLAVNLFESEKIEDAKAAFEEIYQKLTNLPPYRRKGLEWIVSQYAACCEKSHSWKLAEKLLTEVCYLEKSGGPSRIPWYVSALSRMGRAQFHQSKFDEAKTSYETAIEQLVGNNSSSWQLPNCKSWLGIINSKLGNAELAEQQMTDGFNGLIELQQNIPEAWRDIRINQAARRLVEHYSSESPLNQNELKKWKQKYDPQLPDWPVAK